MELEEAHLALEELVGRFISNGSVPFVVGGGNDQSYPNACGMLLNTWFGFRLFNTKGNYWCCQY